MEDATRNLGSAGASQAAGVSPDTARQSDRIDALEHAIDDLRQQVSDLCSGLEAEVRTRRIVVMSGDGFERVVVDALDDHGHVEVRSRGTVDRTTSALLFAEDASDGDPCQVGLALSDEGDITMDLSLYSGHRP